ncbi:MAG: hypothetical protein IID33_17650 [Planctomycetes bacterium]|nr:hypothetical protein [Planctomycetota bacterium]
MFEVWLKGRGHDPEAITDKARADLAVEYEAEIRGKSGDPPGERKDPDRPAQDGKIEKRIESGPSGNGKSTDNPGDGEIFTSGVEAERARVTDINEALELVRGIDGAEAIATRGITGGDEAAAVRRSLLKLTREGREESVGPAIHVRDNEKDCTRATLAAGLLLREGFKPDGKKIDGPLNDRGAFNGVKFTDELAERGERYVDMTMMEMARECIRLDGQTVPHGREELLRRAFTTHAIANVLGATANKLLLKGYDENPGTALMWVGTREVADFKTVTETRLSEASDLKELNQAGEIEHGTVTDVAETYAIKTFGRMYVFTRQDMINDDLGALTTWTQRMGAAANRLVDDRVYTVLLANGNMSDGTALFHADHGNLQTGAGSNLDDTSLDLARQEMREQTDLAGLARLNIIPKFLLGPPALEGLMKRLLQSTEIRRTLTGTTDIDSRETNANIWQNALMPIIEPRIAATGSGGQAGGSDTAYYVVANSNQANHLIAAFLRGFRRPTIERADPPNDVLGIGWRTYFDTEGAALDHRGIHKSDGV